jgi:hypothetical protein
MRRFGEWMLGGFRRDILAIAEYEAWTDGIEVVEVVTYWHQPSSMNVYFKIRHRMETVEFIRGVAIEGESRKRRWMEVHLLHELKQYAEEKTKMKMLLTGGETFEVEERYRKKAGVGWLSRLLYRYWLGRKYKLRGKSGHVHNQSRQSL